MGTHHSVGTPGLGNVRTKTVSPNPRGCFKYSKVQKSELQSCSTCRSILFCVHVSWELLAPLLLQQFSTGSRQDWGEGGMDCWAEEDTFWAVPGVRDGAALRDFGVRAWELCSLLSQSLLGLSLVLEHHFDRVPCLSTPLSMFLVSRSQRREGKGRGTESCSWSFLQSCSHKFQTRKQKHT